MNIEHYINQPIEIQKELLLFFKPNEDLVVFDIGACEGEDSIRYSNLFPKSKIFSFEPLPSNFLKITDNIAKYGKTNIFPFQEALCDKVGKATFYVSSGKPEGLENTDEWNYGNKSSSLFEPADKTKQYYDWLNFQEQILVSTNTIKNFCISNQINKIDFLHLDVQGAELLVLEGAEDFLANAKVIWMEVEKVELYKQQPLKKEVEAFMTNNGFYKYIDTVDKITGDQLYVNKRFTETKLLKKKPQPTFITKIFKKCFSLKK